jgi:predicted Zn finger-like uncharacterized protein
MNVTCPQCKSTYRVDPAKVPQRGVTARCARCPGTFAVSSGRRSEQNDPTEQGIATRSESPVPALHMPTEEASSDRGLQGAEREAGMDPRAPHRSGGELPMGSSEQPASATGDRAASSPELPPAPFGSADPQTRARRLARALVSDIAVYNPERRELSLKEGTLRREFRDEIRKSWDEYVAQVGNQIARETSYFRDALNEILAEGAQLF